MGARYGAPSPRKGQQLLAVTPTRGSFCRSEGFLSVASTCPDGLHLPQDYRLVLVLAVNGARRLLALHRRLEAWSHHVCL